MKQKIYESGRSMVEMVGVLAIAGLITAGAFVLIRGGLASQKRSRAADEVSTIVASVRNLSAERADFANLPPKPSAYADTDGSATLAGAMLGSTSAVATPFSSDSYYAVHKKSGNTQFNVVLVGLTASECTVLKARAWAEQVGTATCDTNNNLTITYGKD